VRSPKIQKTNEKGKTKRVEKGGSDKPPRASGEEDHRKTRVREIYLYRIYTKVGDFDDAEGARKNDEPIRSPEGDAYPPTFGPQPDLEFRLVGEEAKSINMRSPCNGANRGESLVKDFRRRPGELPGRCHKEVDHLARFHPENKGKRFAEKRAYSPHQRSPERPEKRGITGAETPLNF